MKLQYLCILVTALLAFGNSLPHTFKLPDPTDFTEVTSALAKSEPRQMGILGFTALGALMFPILVSLGMASFVSHLPTVFKEFASEFGIPSTPPRNFFLLNRNLVALRRSQQTDLGSLIENLPRQYSQAASLDNNFADYLYKRSRR